MCGIIGYIGKDKPINILLDGLKCLEYRGYDSAGIALKNDKSLQVIKSIGKISNLEKKVNDSEIIESNIGIAHTRWATHGEVNEANCHPHTVSKITLVHNGIIENAKEIKEKLIAEGVKFNSDTDTEVIAFLINKYYSSDAREAIYKATLELKGSYALAILVEKEDKLYAVRKDSPLIVGISDNGLFVASDIAAITSYTNKYFLLDENEVACLGFDGFNVFNNGVVVKKDILEADISKEAIDKCGYDHYMLKEIMEEPVVLEKTLAPYLTDINKLPLLTKYKKIHIVACGSAMYAGMIGKSLFEEMSNVEVVCEVASEYRYKKVFYDDETLVILVSQSGETADTIAALRKAKESNIDTLAIVNVKTSTIARESDSKIFIEAGPEIAVATTKAYILQVAMFSLLSYKLAKDKGILREDILEEFRKLPRLLRQILDCRNRYLEVAQKIYKCQNIFFLGRKIDYAMALEGSLKLKEISYIHSEAYQAGELKHGTISLINEDSFVFAIVTDSDIMDKTISNISEVKARGANIILVSNHSLLEDLEVIVPKVNKFMQPILVVPCLQLIAYEVAKLRGCDIDKPKNLAKSVTVE